MKNTVVSRDFLKFADGENLAVNGTFVDNNETSVYTFPFKL